MLLRLRRLLRFTGQSVWRNLWLAIATTGTVVLTSISLCVLLAVHIGIQQLTDSIERDVDLTVFFFPEVTESQVNSVIVALQARPEISSVTYVSREQALQDFRDRAADDHTLTDPLDVLGENPFGASLVIHAANANDYRLIADELQQPQYENLVEAQQRHFEENISFIERVTLLSSRINRIAIAISLTFATLTVLLLFNAVRMAIYAHHHEITIMRLVGASNSFVKFPFVLEILLYAFVGSAIGVGISIALLAVVQPQLLSYFGGAIELQGFFMRHWYSIYFAEAFALGLLGLLSSLVALNRYLRV